MVFDDQRRTFYISTGRLLAMWIGMGVIFALLAHYLKKISLDVVLVVVLVPTAIGVLHCGYLAYLFYKSSAGSGSDNVINKSQSDRAI
jgi:H+/Cl- antiporter ClcA